MRIKDINIGQGYLVVEAAEPVDVSKFANELQVEIDMGTSPKNEASSAFRNLIKNPDSRDLLRKNLKLDKMHNSYCVIPLSNGSLVIPGLANHKLSKYKVFYVDEKGNNYFKNQEWNVLSELTGRELPNVLNQIYNSLSGSNQYDLFIFRSNITYKGRAASTQKLFQVVGYIPSLVYSSYDNFGASRIIFSTKHPSKKDFFLSKPKKEAEFKKEVAKILKKVSSTYSDNKINLVNGFPIAQTRILEKQGPQGHSIDKVVMAVDGLSIIQELIMTKNEKVYGLFDNIKKIVFNSEFGSRINYFPEAPLILSKLPVKSINSVKVDFKDKAVTYQPLTALQYARLERDVKIPVTKS